MSETSLARNNLAPFCKGYGIDCGFGGDKIIPSAIAVDMPSPYTRVGQDQVQLGGDARDLKWFKDGVLDFVYSSHLLEDFKETAPVLKEWSRVLKKGGNIVLYLPNEQVYRAHCKTSGQPYNLAHSIDNFSLEYMRGVVASVGGLKEIHSSEIVNTYSFELVLEKL